MIIDTSYKQVYDEIMQKKSTLKDSSIFVFRLVCLIKRDKDESFIIDIDNLDI